MNQNRLDQKNLNFVILPPIFSCSNMVCGFNDYKMICFKHLKILYAIANGIVLRLMTIVVCLAS